MVEAVAQAHPVKEELRARPELSPSRPRKSTSDDILQRCQSRQEMWFLKNDAESRGPESRQRGIIHRNEVVAGHDDAAR